MAASTYGTQNQPLFADGDAPDVAVNPTQVSNYAAMVGNRKAGTNAARLALAGADVWPGLQFRETDTNETYVYTNSGWVFEGPWPRPSAQGPSGQTDAESRVTLASVTFTVNAGEVWRVAGAVSVNTANIITAAGAGIIRLMIGSGEVQRIAGSSTVSTVGTYLSGSEFDFVATAGTFTVAVTAENGTSGSALRCPANCATVLAERLS